MKILHLRNLFILLAFNLLAGCAKESGDLSKVDHLRLTIDNGAEKVLFPTTNLASVYRDMPPSVSVLDLPVWLQTGGHDALPILTFTEFGYLSASSIRIRAYIDTGDGHSVSKIDMRIPFENAPADEPKLSVEIDEYLRRESVSYSLDPTITQSAQINVNDAESDVASGEFDFTLCRTEAQHAKTCDIEGNRKHLHVDLRWAIRHGDFSTFPLSAEGTLDAPIDLGTVPSWDTSGISGRKTAGEGSYYKISVAQGVDLEINVTSNFATQSDTRLIVYQDAAFTSELCRTTGLTPCAPKTADSSLYLKATTSNPNGAFFSLNFLDRTPYPERGTIDLRTTSELQYHGVSTGKQVAIVFALDPQKTYDVTFSDTPAAPSRNNGQAYLFDQQELSQRINRESCKTINTLAECIGSQLGDWPLFDDPAPDLPTLCAPAWPPYTCSLQAPSGSVVVYFYWYDWANGLPFTVKLEESSGVTYRNEGSPLTPRAVNERWDGEVAAGTSFYSVATVPNQIYSLVLQTNEDPYFADKLIIGTDAWPRSIDIPHCDYANQCAFRANSDHTRISVTNQHRSIGITYRLLVQPDDHATVSETVNLSDKGISKLSTTGKLSYQGSVGIGDSQYNVDTIPGTTYVITTTSKVDVLSFSTSNCTSGFVTAKIARCTFQAMSNSTKIAVHRATHFGNGAQFTLDIVRDDSTQANP